jgi:hypothetical protein
MRGTFGTPVSNTVAAARKQLRRRLKNPFRPEVGNPLLVHCSHHKVGTVWFTRILTTITDNYGLRMEILGREDVPAATTDVFLFNNSNWFKREFLRGRSFRGSHIIRDPRDLAVSAYHYHLRTTEKWALTPQKRWNGTSYQEYLRSFDSDEGLLLEIRRCAGSEYAHMSKWDYNQEEFLELRYEDMIEDEPASLRKLFEHYGLRDKERDTCVRQAGEFTLDVVRAKNDSHVRSGRPGEWRDAFAAHHVALFKELTGDLVVRLGYETDSDW